MQIRQTSDEESIFYLFAFIFIQSCAFLLNISNSTSGLELSNFLQQTDSSSCIAGLIANNAVS